MTSRDQDSHGVNRASGDLQRGGIPDITVLMLHRAET
jgi:hypothetical protein